MAGKSILAYFKTPEQAQEALEKMKQLRLIDSSIDRFDGMPGDGIDIVTNPLTGDFRRLGDLTMGGEFSGRQDVGILAAASVSAHGLSSGGPENQVAGRDILLTAVVDERDYERAWEIARQAGAL